MPRNRKNLALITLLLAGAATAFSTLVRPTPATAQGEIQPASTVSNEDTCAKLAAVKMDHLVITTAHSQAAMAPVEGARLPGMTGQPGGGPAISGLPAFCRVVGSIHPEAGSDIRFEVWLPSEGWSGRLMGTGNGGLAGSISYSDLASAVKAGQVGASTDTGHSGSPTDSAWAKGHPERVRDYGWRAFHLTTITAKVLIERFYGHKPEHSYYVGCSNGGRMGLMEASRYPEDYDGIVAGAPASNITHLLMSHTWLAQVQMPAGAAILPAQVKLLQAEVLRQCDAGDGQVDGLVADPRQCHFDTARLACGTNASAECFTSPQMAALRKIHEGPHDSKGRQVAFGFPTTGAELGVPVPFFGWDGGIAKGGGKGPIQSAFPTVLTDFPAKPIATDESFNVDRDPARIQAALSGDLNPSPDLRRYFARGGKLIMWHGWADATIPPQYSLAFHEAVLHASEPAAKRQMRLFMVPGVQHCFGGPGPDIFGQIGAPPRSDTPERNVATAMIEWVEKGRAPASLVGRRGIAGMMGAPTSGPEKQRLICAFPAKSVLKPGADPDLAASYSCLPAGARSAKRAHHR